MSLNSKEKIIELPEIIGFLNLSRRLLREIELLEYTNIPKEYAVLTKEAAQKVGTKALLYAENKGGDR